jgi:hypothetical protein
LIKKNADGIEESRTSNISTILLEISHSIMLDDILFGKANTSQRLEVITST